MNAAGECGNEKPTIPVGSTDLLDALDVLKRSTRRDEKRRPTVGPQDLQRALNWNWAKAQRVIQAMRAADPYLEGTKPWTLSLG